MAAANAAWSAGGEIRHGSSGHAASWAGRAVALASTNVTVTTASKAVPTTTTTAAPNSSPSSAVVGPGHTKGAPTTSTTASTSSTTTSVPVATTTPAVPAPPSLAGLTLPQVTTDANWIVSAQLPDGAIAFYPSGGHIWPYLGNQAASGLARAAQITGNQTYAKAAWNQLAWYAAHEEAQGYVTDYTVTNGVETSTGTEDSTDAYAGTFLLAAANAWAADPDVSKLAALHNGLVGAVNAIESTQDSDGLTWAKPSWHVKYLMDQAETYAGLASLPPLADVLVDTSLAGRATTDASRIRAGVAALWDPALASYDWAVHSDGVRQTTNWANLYSDAMEQAWAVGYGLVPTSTAVKLTSHVASSHPEWDRPQAPAILNGTASTAGYWPVAGFAFLNGGQPASAATGGASIQAAAEASKFAWPFTPADAGNLILLASGGPYPVS